MLETRCSAKQSEQDVHTKDIVLLQHTAFNCRFIGVRDWKKKNEFEYWRGHICRECQATLMLKPNRDSDSPIATLR